MVSMAKSNFSRGGRMHCKTDHLIATQNTASRAVNFASIHCGEGFLLSRHCVAAFPVEPNRSRKIMNTIPERTSL
jgi:hypothetical protein